MGKHNFRELKIWQMSMDLAENVYSITQELPNEEKYGLVSQMRRSSVSISSNIAEGSGRTEKEFIRYLNIAISSAYELETQALLCARVFDKDLKLLIREINDIQNMIGGFRRSLRSKNS